jgi:hypothetical protein
MPDCPGSVTQVGPTGSARSMYGRTPHGTVRDPSGGASSSRKRWTSALAYGGSWMRSSCRCASRAIGVGGGDGCLVVVGRRGAAKLPANQQQLRQNGLADDRRLWTDSGVPHRSPGPRLGGRCGTPARAGARGADEHQLAYERAAGRLVDGAEHTGTVARVPAQTRRRKTTFELQMVCLPTVEEELGASYIMLPPA